ncbi:MAG: AEC family transporter [Rhodoferax sp.]|nr:AEC family transporter [Rhodoferax sp.]
MLDILAITCPIYLCILASYLATRWAVFSKADIRVLGKFVLNFALPALLFSAVSQRPLREIMHMDYLLAYGLGSGLVLTCGYLWARYVDRTAPTSPWACRAPTVVSWATPWPPWRWGLLPLSHWRSMGGGKPV